MGWCWYDSIGGFVIAASPAAVIVAPLVAAVGVGMVRVGVDLLNGEFNKVSFEVTAPINFGSETITHQQMMIAQIQMYQHDSTYNHKYQSQSKF